MNDFTYGHEPFSVIFARLSRDLGSDDASNRRQFACDTNIQRLHIRPSHTNPNTYFLFLSFPFLLSSTPLTMENYRIIKHKIPAAHLREFPQATLHSEEDILHLAVNQYIPLNNPHPQPGDVTIIAAHAVGYHKELYEPLWDELAAQARFRGWRIRSIWMADVAWHGESYQMNEELVGNSPGWYDHSRDLANLINLKREEMVRPIVGVGHSMGGNQMYVFFFCSFFPFEKKRNEQRKEKDPFSPFLSLLPPQKKTPQCIYQQTRKESIKKKKLISSPFFSFSTSIQNKTRPRPSFPLHNPHPPGPSHPDEIRRNRPFFPSPFCRTSVHFSSRSLAFARNRSRVVSEISLLSDVG